LAQLNVLIRISKVQELKPRAGQHIYTNALMLSNRGGTPASVVRMAATCPAHLNSNGQFQPIDASADAESQRLLSRQMQSSKLQFAKTIDRCI
jgi:hypothetical protein